MLAWEVAIPGLTILNCRFADADADAKTDADVGKQVNALITANTSEVTGPPQRLDPAKGNVCFASAQHGWAFTTGSFAKVRIEQE